MLISLLRITAAVSGVPLAALMVLVGIGSAAPTPALIAATAVVFAALGLALVLINDLRVLAELLHVVGSGGRGAIPPAGAAPLSLSAQVLGEVAFVSQTLGERADEVDRLRRAEESILERLPDPLIVLGPDRAVRRANASARAAFGVEMAAVLRHPDLRAAIDRALAAGEAGRPQVAEVSVPVPVPREVHATVAALDSPLAGGPGVLVVLSDRTRERAVERTRADFVANASHELRTPLASLMGFIDTLRGPAADDPPAQARFLEIMAEQAARMNRLIDDLLSLSRIELIEHQLPDDQVDMVELTERMLASFEIRLRQRRTKLDFVSDRELAPVTGDPDQLEQVLQNLLDNGLKYGRESGLLRVSLSQVPPGGRWPARNGVVLSVTDDGPGIPQQHLPRLTERFYRVDTGRSRAIGGTGLGLAIVKHVVNRHRGQLLIESEEGQGATFSVWLPAA
jgi:two-component system, OmpR family, phosphate regulon sensor histidine kinase PhoR